MWHIYVQELGGGDNQTQQGWVVCHKNEGMVPWESRGAYVDNIVEKPSDLL